MQIYANDDNILFLVDNLNAKLHSHIMIQISISLDSYFKINILDNTLNCNGIIINSSVSHSFNNYNNPQLFVLVDPTSDLGSQIKLNILENKPYVFIENNVCESIISIFSNYTTPFFSEDEFLSFQKNIFNELNIKAKAINKNNEVTGKILKEIKISNLENFTTDKLSKKLFLSKSRLSHIFKYDTGLSLHSYILLQRLQKTIIHALKGNSLTESSLLNGFNSSSHFSYTTQKMLGISFREFNKDSYFLKVSKL